MIDHIVNREFVASVSPSGEPKHLHIQVFGTAFNLYIILNPQLLYNLGAQKANACCS